MAGLPFLFSAAAIGLSGALLLTNNTEPNGEAKYPYETFAYKAGAVAGDIKRGFNAGADGMPPCHEAYYADVKYNPESCGSDAKKFGQIVGHSVSLISQGYKHGQ